MAHALIVETVTGQTMADLIAARDAAADVDMVEVRLDGVSDLDVAGAIQGRRHRVIVTCRPVWEGGRFDGSEEERRTLLSQALAAGAEYIDVEWRAGFADLIANAPSRIIVSSHDFRGVPSDLADRASAMRQTGASVIKVAVMAQRLSDALPLVDIGRAGNAVVIAMGDAGLPSRLLAARFDSLWTYAGNAVAPGQIPAARMLREFRFRRIGPATSLYGVVGNNVMHSMSPVMHNAAFETSGLDAAYVPLPTSDFDDFLTFANALGIAGASVTIPFKVDALEVSEHADDKARQVGAANTLRRAGAAQSSANHGGWDATNTDVDGFLDALDAVHPQPLRGARAAVLGAGGSARAVVAALASRGAQITVYARRYEQAVAVASLGAGQAGLLPPPAGSWDVLVNCTPLGGPSARNETPLPGGSFDGSLVYDLTYGDHESPLLREARQAGCRTVDGLPMLIAQAERQFEWWTGQRPRARVMRTAARRRMGIPDSGVPGIPGSSEPDSPVAAVPRS